jgi:threonyl-tRNA synthetase
MAEELTVTLPDGSRRSLPKGSTAGDLARAIGRRLAQAAVAARVDGQLVDLNRPLPEGASVAIVTEDTDEGRAVLRHSTAHVLAQAVCTLWPGARYALGPAIADGFYYDFELPGGARFSDEDLGRIAAEMRRIIAEDQPFVREELDPASARELFADQPYKREVIDAVTGGDPTAPPEASADLVPGERLSVYRNGGRFVDLCRGPHVPSTGRLGHFALQRVAGAYWRGDEHRPQLQRIYGTAWESAEALQAHLDRLAEAERRDHRRLGQELDLFSFPTEVGPGLVLFHPRGGTVRRLMEEYARRTHERAGYQMVYSPHVTKQDLFERSGHLETFAEGMYPPMELDEGQRYYLKPMNCPFHILVYRSRQRSYRELPLRFFELGTVYRYEKSGVVHGLTRVRGMTQDDAHVFCTREQMGGELEGILRLALAVLRDYGLEDFYVELSTRPEGKALGTDEEWEEATAALEAAAKSVGLVTVLDEGGGAFYGPKVSVQVRDAIGRHWQVSTVQLDFQLPRRFDLEYVGADNARHRPVMIHRALFGSVERFLGILLEHTAGHLPVWLAPVQAAVLPVRDDHQAYAEEVRHRLAEAGVRAELDPADEPLGARIRRRRLERVPYVLVVGQEDLGAGTVGVNRRGAEQPERGVPLERLVAELSAGGVA